MIVSNEDFAVQLTRAVAGDNAAMQTVLQEYDPLFRSRSMIDGAFDEDCYQYILCGRLRKHRNSRVQKYFFRRRKKSNEIFHFTY